MKKIKIVLLVIFSVCILLGMTGCGPLKKETEAVLNLEEEAYLSALDLRYESKYDEAFSLISQYLNSEDMKMQYLLGDSYFYGYGVEISDSTAFSWYMKGAEQGNKICQYNVGYFYAIGAGTEQNKEQGKQWLEKSALQGYNLFREQLLSIDY